MDRVISEQAVMGAINDTALYKFRYDLIKRIKAIPSVVYHPETAHWTKDFTCSSCGCKCYPMDIDFGDYNFCPNCGREMKEGESGV